MRTRFVKVQSVTFEEFVVEPFRPRDVMGYPINEVEIEYEDSEGDLRSIPSNGEDEHERFPPFNAATDMVNPQLKVKQVFPSFNVLKRL